jgi:V/A-type H+-transporting ATPase subunit C
MSVYPFLFTRVRGKLSRLVDEESLKSADLEAVIDRLRQTPYGPHLEATDRLDDRLLQGLFTEVNSLLRLLNEEDRHLVLDVLAKYRLENLKVILRTYLHRLPPEEAEGRLIAVPWEEADYKGWLRLAGLEALIEMIPWPEEQQRLTIILKQVGVTENPFPYEAGLDSLYLERLLQHRLRRSHWVSEILGNRVLKELIFWGYRLKGYGRSFPEMVNIMPDSRSLITLDELKAILEEENGWRRLGRWLGRPLAKELERARAFDPDMIARLLDEQLLLLEREILFMAVMDIAVVLGYLYWKELELRKLIALVERAR